MKKALVIHNPRAGLVKQTALWHRLAKVFGEYRIHADFETLNDGNGIDRLVQQAVGEGVSVVVAAGGDGTVSSVASRLIGSNTVLGVIPVGTLNHFARDMRIPLDVDQAAHTVAAGQIRAADAGEVNGRIFINNSSIGLYPTVVRGRELQQRLGRSKPAALAWGVLAALRRHPSGQVRLSLDNGQSVIRHTPLVFVGNNRYEMSGLKIGSRATLDQGKLHLYVLRRDGALSLIQMGIRSVMGALRGGVDFDCLMADNVRIDVGRSSLHVANDGELLTFAPPLVYRSLPGALRVIVPREWPRARSDDLRRDAKGRDRTGKTGS